MKTRGVIYDAGTVYGTGLMTRLFHSAYPEYQQSTKMLIPFIC